MSNKRFSMKSGYNSETIWLKPKTIKNKKGEEIEVFQGSVDQGGGKMMKVTLYRDLSIVSTDDGDLLPCRLTKWKSDRNSKNKRQKAAY